MDVPHPCFVCFVPHNRLEDPSDFLEEPSDRLEEPSDRMEEPFDRLEELSDRSEEPHSRLIVTICYFGLVNTGCLEVVPLYDISLHCKV